MSTPVLREFACSFVNVVSRIQQGNPSRSHKTSGSTDRGQHFIKLGSGSDFAPPRSHYSAFPKTKEARPTQPLEHEIDDRQGFYGSFTPWFFTLYTKIEGSKAVRIKHLHTDPMCIRPLLCYTGNNSFIPLIRIGVPLLARRIPLIHQQFITSTSSQGILFLQ